MKVLSLILIFIFSQSLLAKEKCTVYELQGTVKEVNDRLELWVAEKTLSQKNFKIPLKIELSFSPYVDKFIKGQFIFKGEDLQTNESILSVESIDLSTPDPLNQNEKNTMKKVKGIKCPSI